MEAWVGFTLFAAAMQTARTAGQKAIVQSLGAVTVTAVRYLFALPFVLLYLFFVAGDTALQTLTSAMSWSFAVYLLLAGIAQIVATLMLVKLLDHRNFAIATVLSKTEALQAAVFGAVFLGALLSWQAWTAVVLGSIGVIVLSLQSKVNAIDVKSAGLGLLCGAGFALTALWIREASLSLNFSYLLNAALSLAFMTFIQSVLCLLIVMSRNSNGFQDMRAEFVKCVFVGATSAAGSVGWFTALALANAALVRTLGQIEIVFAVLLTYLLFGEKISTREWLGLALLIGGIVLILWSL
ncbi:MAG: DMT family transporter [Pseudomonadales bacterium]